MAFLKERVWRLAVWFPLILYTRIIYAREVYCFLTLSVSFERSHPEAASRLFKTLASIAGTLSGLFSSMPLSRRASALASLDLFLQVVQNLQLLTQQFVDFPVGVAVAVHIGQ